MRLKLRRVAECECALRIDHEVDEICLCVFFYDAIYLKIVAPDSLSPSLFRDNEDCYIYSYRISRSRDAHLSHARHSVINDVIANGVI